MTDVARLGVGIELVGRQRGAGDAHRRARPRRDRPRRRGAAVRRRRGRQVPAGDRDRPSTPRAGLHRCSSAAASTRPSRRCPTCRSPRSSAGWPTPPRPGRRSTPALRHLLPGPRTRAASRPSGPRARPGAGLRRGARRRSTSSAASGPTLLVVEDLHWADRSSRDLLVFLLSRLAGQRLRGAGHLPLRRPAPPAPAAPGARRAGPAARRGAGRAGPLGPGRHAGSWSAGSPTATLPEPVAARRRPRAARATRSSPRSWSRPRLPTGLPHERSPRCCSPGSTALQPDDPAGAADGRRSPAAGSATTSWPRCPGWTTTSWSRRCARRSPHHVLVAEPGSARRRRLRVPARAAARGGVRRPAARRAEPAARRVRGAARRPRRGRATRAAPPSSPTTRWPRHDLPAGAGRVGRGGRARPTSGRRPAELLLHAERALELWPAVPDAEAVAGRRRGHASPGGRPGAPAPPATRTAASRSARRALELAEQRGEPQLSADAAAPLRAAAAGPGRPGAGGARRRPSGAVELLAGEPPSGDLGLGARRARPGARRGSTGSEATAEARAAGAGGRAAAVPDDDVDAPRAERRRPGHAGRVRRVRRSRRSGPASSSPRPTALARGARPPRRGAARPLRRRHLAARRRPAARRPATAFAAGERARPRPPARPGAATGSTCGSATVIARFVHGDWDAAEAAAELAGRVRVGDRRRAGSPPPGCSSPSAAAGSTRPSDGWPSCASARPADDQVVLLLGPDRRRGGAVAGPPAGWPRSGSTRRWRGLRRRWSPAPTWARSCSARSGWRRRPSCAADGGRRPPRPREAAAGELAAAADARPPRSGLARGPARSARRAGPGCGRADAGADPRAGSVRARTRGPTGRRGVRLRRARLPAGLRAAAARRGAARARRRRRGGSARGRARTCGRPRRHGRRSWAPRPLAGGGAARSPRRAGSSRLGHRSGRAAARRRSAHARASGRCSTLVAGGRTNRQVGAELFISEKTVSVHLSRVMAKLGAASRTEAVSVAYARGLLSPGGEPDRRTPLSPSPLPLGNYAAER